MLKTYFILSKILLSYICVISLFIFKTYLLRFLQFNKEISKENIKYSFIYIIGICFIITILIIWMKDRLMYCSKNENFMNIYRNVNKIKGKNVY